MRSPNTFARRGRVAFSMIGMVFHRFQSVRRTFRNIERLRGGAGFYGKASSTFRLLSGFIRRRFYLLGQLNFTFHVCKTTFRLQALGDSVQRLPLPFLGRLQVSSAFSVHTSRPIGSRVKVPSSQ